MKNLPKIPFYHWVSQEGTNSFGGVAILLNDTIREKTIEKQQNFILVEIEIDPKPILIGAIYIPPSEDIPCSLFNKYLDKPFYIFGDFNAKHREWQCDTNNTSGIQLQKWLEESSCEMIRPNKPTSRKSSATIDFGITHDARKWKAEVLDEGTSDHYPVKVQSPLSIGTEDKFRRTNWEVFTFFLKCLFPYFNALVYNLDADPFFKLSSTFLAAVWDRTSDYIPIKLYRPPWPIDLIRTTREYNSARRRYRIGKTRDRLVQYLYWKERYHTERSQFLQKRMMTDIEKLSNGSNI